MTDEHIAELLAHQHTQNKGTFLGSTRAYNLKNMVWGPEMMLGSRRLRKVMMAVGWGEERIEPRSFASASVCGLRSANLLAPFLGPRCFKLPQGSVLHTIFFKEEGPVLV